MDTKMRGKSGRTDAKDQSKHKNKRKTLESTMFFFTSDTKIDHSSCAAQET